MREREAYWKANGIPLDKEERRAWRQANGGGGSRRNRPA